MSSHRRSWSYLSCKKGVVLVLVGSVNLCRLCNPKWSTRERGDGSDSVLQRTQIKYKRMERMERNENVYTAPPGPALGSWCAAVGG